MTGAGLVLAAALGTNGLAAPAPVAMPIWALVQGGQEVIAEVRVHGNHVTSDEEILKLAGLTLGAPVGATTIEDFKKRLERSGKFDEVQVLKRFASISDLSKISIIIIVNEGPVRIEIPRGENNPDPVRIVRRTGLDNLMMMPILDAEDGYGLTYGGRVAWVDVAGERSRLSFPLTWGGLKRAGVELEKNFVSGPLSRIELGAAIQRRENPAYDINDDRRRTWIRAEKAAGMLRVGATAGFQQVDFDIDKDTLKTIGADVVVDTRIDPTLPRNAVYARAGWERVKIDRFAAPIQRTRIEARGYLGLVRQTVLEVRAARESANQAQPRYLRSLLGGWSSLRGFQAGAFTGDTVVTTTAELIVPLSSPLSIGRMGISTFVDAGVAYDYGQRFRDQKRQVGIGASVWMTATIFKLSLSVAHGRGAGTRVNFGGGLTF